MVEHKKRSSTDPLQVLREGVAVLISMVVLGLAAWTIGQTFLAARGDNVDAYNREKDIMLYVVSLFGTVTGYYLGRVPAEVNARRAETAARTAQQQLSESQEKLGAASAEASTARSGEQRAAKRLSRTTGELRNVSEAIGKLQRGSQAAPAGGVTGARGGYAPPPPAGTFGIRGEDDVQGGGDAELVEAKRRIDALLAQLAEDEGLA